MGETFTTEFALGQEVFLVGRNQVNEQMTCPACEGQGRISVTGADGVEMGSYCPHKECRGRGHWTVRRYQEFVMYGIARVGRIELKAYSPELAPARYPAYEENYMLDETGIGTGTVYPKLDGNWTHTHLFATMAEAQRFCEVENPGLLREAVEV